MQTLTECTFLIRPLDLLLRIKTKRVLGFEINNLELKYTEQIGKTRDAPIKQWPIIGI